MSRAVIQDIVSEMADDFIAEGLADTGVYTAPGGQPIACRVFITRGGAPFGNFGTVIGGKDRIGMLLQEIPQPARGATLIADGQTFVLAKFVASDDSIETWEVA